MPETFKLTYPCYLPLAAGSYHLIVVDGKSCMPLLTGKDKASRFFRSRGVQGYPATAEVQTIADREKLLEVFRDLQARYANGQHGAGHVAFDPSGKAAVPYTTILEFIEFIESQTE